MESAQDIQPQSIMSVSEPSVRVITPLPTFVTQEEKTTPIVASSKNPHNFWARLTALHWIILFLIAIGISTFVYRAYHTPQKSPVASVPCLVATPSASLTQKLTVTPTKVTIPTTTPIYIRVTATPTILQHTATVSAK